LEYTLLIIVQHYENYKWIPVMTTIHGFLTADSCMNAGEEIKKTLEKQCDSVSTICVRVR